MTNPDHNFNIAHSSLTSNIAWWTNRLALDDVKEVKEAEFEIKRCKEFLRILIKKHEEEVAKREKSEVK